MDITGVTRIVMISIRHGATIDAMSINLQINEYITNVRGHIAPWGNTLQVRSLTFATNLNTYGPYGTQEGVPFKLPAVGDRVVGFFARAGPVGRWIPVSQVSGPNQRLRSGAATFLEHDSGDQ
ncbi:Mannose-binding lectin superfamily protein [Rhynchospora pubera]|uniref:Mannose-binding lectin superfamily protein n=1 Tax=Rhynchospora pubera TaxID=906938 RepID=A0AAV8DGP1_9POAL|nr:Mannose-binding lectin superfamily protein [Rhynchospora pubera]